MLLQRRANQANLPPAKKLAGLFRIIEISTASALLPVQQPLNSHNGFQREEKEGQKEGLPSKLGQLFKRSRLLS
jgi:hypothetical protein